MMLSAWQISVSQADASEVISEQAEPNGCGSKTRIEIRRMKMSKVSGAPQPALIQINSPGVRETPSNLDPSRGQDSIP